MATTPQMPDGDFTELIALLTQNLTETGKTVQLLQTTVASLETRVSVLESGQQQMVDQQNKLSGEMKTVKTETAQVTKLRDEVKFQVTAVNKLAADVLGIQKNAVMDIKLGELERADLYNALGYVDQVPYVITEVYNWNQDAFPDQVAKRKILKLVNGIWQDLGSNHK